MRFEKGHKEITRQRIIDVASERFRKDGIANVGIAGVMADAGLTHGGFYAHFESKDDLLREAVAAAAARTNARLDRAAAAGQGVEARIRRYLRAAHRDTPAQGCVIATLAAEITRLDTVTREAFSGHVENMLARLAAQLPEDMPQAARRPAAVGVFSVMLGALQLARSVSDPAASDKILEDGVSAALRLAGVAPAS
jgi:TetR/AcrR family transcriptional repressor of nem operon